MREFEEWYGARVLIAQMYRTSAAIQVAHIFFYQSDSNMHVLPIEIVICILDGCHFPIAFVLMLDLLYTFPFCGPGLLACGSIGPRLALAARCG